MHLKWDCLDLKWKRCSYKKTNNRQKTTFRVSYLVTFQTKLIIECQYILNGESIDALLVLFSLNTRYYMFEYCITQLAKFL